MNKTLGVILLVISLLFAIFRMARCSKRIDSMQRKNATEKYYTDCQNALDTAWYYFKPIALAMKNNQPVPEDKLTYTTTHLYDASTTAGNISAYDDEGSYYKNFVKDFIEHERGLTCCYLKKYQEEMAKTGKLQKATSHNLLTWIEKYEKYSGIFGNTRFVLNNGADLSGFKSVVMAASPKN